MYCHNVKDVMSINMTMCELCSQCALPLDPGSEVDDDKKNCDLYWLWKNGTERARAQASSSLAKILTVWSILALHLCFNDVILKSYTNDQLTYLPGRLKLAKIAAGATYRIQQFLSSSELIEKVDQTNKQTKTGLLFSTEQ